MTLQETDSFEDLAKPTQDAEGAQSPFLPGTNIQFAWDATSIELLKRCPRLYQYKMIDGWNTEEESVHLRFGIEFHQALQDYELEKAAEIPHRDAVFDVVKALIDRIEDWKPDHKYKNREFLVRTVIWYLEKYKDDPAVTCIMPDGRPAVEVSFSFELDYGPTEDQPYVICGHLDRVAEFNEEVLIMDHKTTTSTPTEWYWNQFDPNNQMTTYTLAGKVIFQATVRGVIINSAQIMIDGTRFTRGFTYRNEDQLSEWVNDLKIWLEAGKRYAEANYWPMNDTACDKYGGCKFRDICSKSPAVRERFLESNYVKEEPWNPLKAR